MADPDRKPCYPLKPPNYTDIPNEALDRMGEFTHIQLVVFLAVCRFSLGWFSDPPVVRSATIDSMADYCGRTKEVLKDVIDKLTVDGHIRFDLDDNGYRLAFENGTRAEGRRNDQDQ